LGFSSTKNQNVALVFEPSLGFGLTIVVLLQGNRCNCRLTQLSLHLLHTHTHNLSELPPTPKKTRLFPYFPRKTNFTFCRQNPRRHFVTRLWFQCHSLRWNLTQDVQATESGESHEGTACCLRVKFHRDLTRPKTIKR